MLHSVCGIEPVKAAAATGAEAEAGGDEGEPSSLPSRGWLVRVRDRYGSVAADGDDGEDAEEAMIKARVDFRLPQSGPGQAQMRVDKTECDATDAMR